MYCPIGGYSHTKNRWSLNVLSNPKHSTYWQIYKALIWPQTMVKRKEQAAWLSYLPSQEIGEQLFCPRCACLYCDREAWTDLCYVPVWQAGNFLLRASHKDSREMKEAASSAIFLATAKALCAESPHTYSENSQAWPLRLGVLNHSNLSQCFKFAT